MGSTLFKIKFAFKETDENGKEVKNKLEVIAQCENYTDAEKLAYALAEDYEMAKIEPFSYEIVKLKFTVHDVIYTDAISYQKEVITHGFIQSYFEDETSNIYVINIVIYGEKGVKVKRTYCVPAADAASAINYLKNDMASHGYAKDDYNIVSAKMDNAIEMYLLPKTHEVLVNSHGL